MRNAKLVICLILSISIGIAATTPLLRAELSVKPWITHIQGPNAPFNIEVVYANFTITNVDTPITQISGPVINYYFVVNVTNPSKYRASLFSTYLSVGQNVQNITSKTPLTPLFDESNTFEAGEAKGAWVDGVYYNVTLTIPYPYSGEPDTNYYQWKEGVQYYKNTIKNGANTNTYIYLNIDGTWTDVTGRVIIDEPEPESKTLYTVTGSVISHFVTYPGSWSEMSKDNCFFDPGESRLIAISGSWTISTLTEFLPAWSASGFVFGGSIDSIDIIRSGTVQILAQAESLVDIEPIGEDNTYIDMRAKTSEVQKIILTQVENSYIYNTVLSDNQMFQLDRYGFEVFIVPMEGI